MPTWVIQRVEALIINDGQDLAKVNEPLFIDRFTNEIDFAAARHEGGISGVVQDNDDHNADDNSNTY